RFSQRSSTPLWCGLDPEDRAPKALFGGAGQGRALSCMPPVNPQFIMIWTTIILTGPSIILNIRFNNSAAISVTGVVLIRQQIPVGRVVDLERTALRTEKI
ncbi:MAG: hypothetical protein VCB63_08315, partial [Alphaproteobacteria bacterium]